MRLHLAIVLKAIDDLKKWPDDRVLKEWLLVDGLCILEGYRQPIAQSTWKNRVDQICNESSKLMQA